MRHRLRQPRELTTRCGVWIEMLTGTMFDVEPDDTDKVSCSGIRPTLQMLYE